MKTTRSKQRKSALASPESRKTKAPDPRIRHLLVPLDFSGKSRQALKYAIPLARQFRARISLLHVVEPVYLYPIHEPVGGASQIEVDSGEQKRAAAKQLDQMALQLVPTEHHGRNLVSIGSARQIIVDTIRRQGIDMVVIATKGRSGLPRLLLGSTAEYVVRHAACPVLTVRRQ